MPGVQNLQPKSRQPHAFLWATSQEWFLHFYVFEKHQKNNIKTHEDDVKVRFQYLQTVPSEVGRVCLSASSQEAFMQPWQETMWPLKSEPSTL